MAAFDQDIGDTLKQLVQQGADPQVAFQAATKAQSQRDKISNLSSQHDQFQQQTDSYSKPLLGVSGLHYTLLDPNSNANVTKLAPLAAGAALAPFTGGLSLAGAAAITGGATAAAELAREKANNESIDPLNAVKEGAIQGGLQLVGGKLLDAAGNIIANRVEGTALGDMAKKAGAYLSQDVRDVIPGKASSSIPTNPASAIPTSPVTPGSAPSDNLLQKAGSTLRKGVLNPQVSADPFMAENEQQLLGTAQKYNLKGTAQNQVSQLPEAFRSADTKIQTLLKSSDYSVPTEDFKNQLTTAVRSSEQVNSDPLTGEFASKSGENAFNSYMNKIFTGKGDTLSASDIYGIKKQLGDLNAKSFNAVQPTEAQQIGTVLYNTAQHELGTISPEINVLNRDQNDLYAIAKGLKTSEGRPLKIGPVPLPRGVVQGAQDLVGRGVTSIGNGAANVGSVYQAAKASGTPLAGIANTAIGGVNNVANPPQANPPGIPQDPRSALQAPSSSQPGQAANPQDVFAQILSGQIDPQQAQVLLTGDQGVSGSPSLPLPNSPTLTQAQLNQAIAIDTKRTGGANIAKLKAIYDAQNPAVPQSVQDTIAGASAATNLVNGLASSWNAAYGNDTSTLGRLAGKVRDIKGGITGTDPEQAAFYQQQTSFLPSLNMYLSQITRFNPEEASRISASIPLPTDTAIQAAAKIKALRSLITSNLQGALQTPLTLGQAQQYANQISSNNQ